MILAGSTGEVVTYGPLLLAVPIAVAAGLVSFLSPCCLPLVPGYLAYVGGSAGADVSSQPRHEPGLSGEGSIRVSAKRRALRSRTVAGTMLFILGFSLVFVSYGAAFGAVGGLLIEHQVLITRVLGVFTIALGLLFAGFLNHVPLLNRTVRLEFKPQVGVASAPLLGIMFGIGWTPCIGPTLAAVLALSTSSGGAGRGAVLSFAYSLGLGLPFLLAALGDERALNVFSYARRHAQTVMRCGGVMLIVVGILQVSGAWARVMVELQVLVSNWQPPI